MAAWRKLARIRACRRAPVRAISPCIRTGASSLSMNELDSTIVSMALDEATGKLSMIDAKPAVPAEARDGNHCADIQISPDGRFVYGSNRGHDSVVIMAVDQQTGSLEPRRLCPLRRCDAAQPGADAVRRPSVLGQSERRPHLDLRPRRRQRHADRHRAGHRDRHADVRQDRALTRLFAGLIGGLRSVAGRTERCGIVWEIGEPRGPLDPNANH